jgi:hypothetical protein
MMAKRACFPEIQLNIEICSQLAATDPGAVAPGNGPAAVL